MTDILALQVALGYEFHDKSLLERALTHSSYANELNRQNHHLLCNERLEFLGDSVLQVISSDFIYDKYPDYPEGDLTNIRSLLVCEEALYAYAQKWELGKYLKLGKGESEMGGAEKPAILADAVEAILAAVFMDAGRMAGIPAVQNILYPLFEESLPKLGYSAEVGSTNFKSRLQEFAQKDKYELTYVLTDESGPDHQKTFTFEVYMGSNKVGVGVGSSKHKAQQAAARDALHLFGLENE